MRSGDRDQSPASARGVAGSVLIVDDAPGARQSVRLCLEARGLRVRSVATLRAAIETLEREVFDAIVLDVRLGPERGTDLLPVVRSQYPDTGVVVVSALPSFESAVEAMRGGAADYLPKPFTPDQIRRAVERVIATRRSRSRLEELQAHFSRKEDDAILRSSQPAMRRLLETADRAAASDADVLLLGETGTGTDALARRIHARSGRSDRPFHVIDDPSDAWDRRAVPGGTLFVTELCDLSPAQQAAMLALVNNRARERLTDTTHVLGGVRVIAATSRPVEEDVRSGRVRPDLFHRLTVVTLALPSLRERPEDILPIAHHYVAMFAAQRGRPAPTLSAEAETALLSHEWPGNTWELRNTVERAVTLAVGNDISSADLAPPTLSDALDRSCYRARLGAPVPLEAIEREHIARVLAQAVSLDAAARVLRMAPSTLHRKRKRYGLL
ncbi:MAG: sigma-54-dependent transcriptional regulator [Vicinamibacterales bacterium]